MIEKTSIFQDDFTIKYDCDLRSTYARRKNQKITVTDIVDR